MKDSRSIISTALAGMLLSGMIFSSCSKSVDDPVSPDSNTKNGTTSVDFSKLNLPYADGMTRAEPGTQPPVIPPLSPLDPPVDGEAVIEAIYNNIHGIIINQKKVYNAGFAFDEMSIFNPSSNQVYPGSVFVGSSITNGKFLNLKSTIGNVRWSANGLVPENAKDNYSQSVLDPKASDYNSTIQGWLSTPAMPLSATTTFEVNEVSNSKELGVQIGIGYDSDDLKAKLDLSVKEEKMKTHVLVKAVQKAFSVALDVPDAKTSILKTADVADMDGVMPVYVSEVFYGRLAYAVISSNHEYHEVVAALNLNLPTETEKIDINLSSKYKEILDSSVSKTYIIGGSSQEHGYGLSNGWEGFKKAIGAPLVPYSAKPVAYTLRYVNDNSVARVVLMSDYVLNESYFIPDVTELKVRFRPSTARAKAGTFSPVFLYGSVKMKPSNSNAWVTLFDRPMSKYVKLENGETDADISTDDEVELVIRRPSGMSMTDFLAMKLDVYAEFGHTQAAGTVKVKDLGKKEAQITVKDLIFSGLKGLFNVYTTANLPGEYEANIVFVPSITTDGITKIEDKYGY
ncbi:MAG: thiol-activated cytolysin family protein [Porphyromonas sp.]|nr:thiol-activated cytolysin family protein [Bacteroidales bacterium]MDD7559413.1 thiol-activated cytolysin family protein [Bacteroidales bacterium]MDY3099956.1 thiol-activated cytolysin family protein [Porphyromonas sp.]